MNCLRYLSNYSNTSVNEYKNQKAVYEWVNSSDDLVLWYLVYEWVRFFEGQVYEWGRFRNTGSNTSTTITPKFTTTLPPIAPHPAKRIKY